VHSIPHTLQHKNRIYINFVRLKRPPCGYRIASSSWGFSLQLLPSSASLQRKGGGGGIRKFSSCAIRPLISDNSRHYPPSEERGGGAGGLMMLQMKNSDVWTADCRTIRNHTKTSEGMSGLNIAGIYLPDKRRGVSRQFERTVCT
jgi:hypothetical protein